MSAFQGKEFLALKKEWDRRLAESGLEDCEARDLEKHRRRHARARDLVENAAREMYFSLAAEWLHVTDWPSGASRHIWELHSEGLSVREIAERLGCGARLVQYRVERSREKMFEWRRCRDD